MSSISRQQSPLICEIFSELRATGEFCDAILRSDDQRLFHVHRAILCCENFELKLDENFIFNSQRAVRFFELFSPME